MIRRWCALAAALLLVCGCSTQEKAQQQLIMQLQAGIDQVAQHCEQRQELIEQGYRQKREMLDRAFDADVLARQQIDAQWVVEHRKAYAAGMEAIWSAQQASRLAHERAMANLAAISEAMQRLRWMSEMREGWGKALEKLRREVSDESR